MKTIVYILLLFPLVIQGCKEDNDEPEVPLTGIVTIDNTTFKSSTYYIIGYTFSSGTKVSTLENPGPDISVYVNPVNPQLLYFIANNLHPSFAKIGDYATEDDANTAFNGLKEVPANAVWVELAEPLLPNQIWIYRSGGNERFTKMRIVSTFAESRFNTPLNQYFDYGECTFEYVYQPDGSLTFP